MTKLPTMYISIKKENGKVQMLSAKRIKRITNLLPSKELIQAHLDLERKLVRETKGYMPVPYEIAVSVKNYDMIINDIQKKLPKYNTKSISLRASSKSATIIKIIVRDEINK